MLVFDRRVIDDGKVRAAWGLMSPVVTTSLAPTLTLDAWMSPTDIIPEFAVSVTDDAPVLLALNAAPAVVMLPVRVVNVAVFDSTAPVLMDPTPPLKLVLRVTEFAGFVALPMVDVVMPPSTAEKLTFETSSASVVTAPRDDTEKPPPKLPVSEIALPLVVNEVTPLWLNPLMVLTPEPKVLVALLTLMEPALIARTLTLPSASSCNAPVPRLIVSGPAWLRLATLPLVRMVRPPLVGLRSTLPSVRLPRSAVKSRVPPANWPPPGPGATDAIGDVAKLAPSLLKV